MPIIKAEKCADIKLVHGRTDKRNGG